MCVCVCVCPRAGLDTEARGRILSSQRGSSLVPVHSHYYSTADLPRHQELNDIIKWVRNFKTKKESACKGRIGTDKSFTSSAVYTVRIFGLYLFTEYSISVPEF
jgi:hypothetical protein